MKRPKEADVTLLDRMMVQRQFVARCGQIDSGVSDRSAQNNSQAEVTRPGITAASDELGRHIVLARGGQEEVIPLSAGQAVGVPIVDHRGRVKHVTAVPDAAGKCGNPLVLPV